WWYAHNLFGLWLTPMLLALTYYIVPRVTNTPLYSYTLSLVSFWGMAFFYTGVGDHHILQSPTPAWLKTIAEVSSWMLLVPVFAFTINILGTMKGNWDRFFTNLPLRFTMTAFFFYFLVNIQGAFEALQPFNKLTHFTNFVVAHAHLALLGAFTILGMGVIDYIVAQVFARPLWSRSLTEWQYWLVTAGFARSFGVLTLAGFQQGVGWGQGSPEVNVLPTRPFDPPASADWAPLSDGAVKGRNLFASNDCYVCHSGYSRPQDVREALYFLYPKVSQPGDFYGSDQSPNLLGTERTGPDLS